MAFDVESALKAGYSRSEIADYLASQSKFDVSSARKAGYSDDEILSHLQGSARGKKDEALAQAPAAAEPRAAAPTESQPSTGYTDPMGNVAASEAAPGASSSKGLISRVSNALRPEYRSVMEGYQSTPQQQQADADRRLSYGAGPISQETAATADLVRSGLARSNEPIVNRVAQAMTERGETSFGDLLARAKDPEIIRGARMAKAEEFRSPGEWAIDTLSSLGQGVTQAVELPINIIAPSSDMAQYLRGIQKEWQAQDSDVQQAQRENFRQRLQTEEGFFNKYIATVEELVTSPAMALSEAIKQVPMFLGVLGGAKVGAALAGSAVGAVGKVSPTLALGEAISGGAIRAGAQAAGSTAGGVVASAVMTGGDAAGSVYERLTDPRQTPLEVWKQNPDYQRLTAEGKSSKEAIEEIATTKARLAAVITAPLGVFGFMGAEAAIASRGLVRAATQMAGPKTAAKTFGKEIAGEQIEEGGTQLGANVLTRTVDPSQSLTEGVPEAMGTALVTSTPFAAIGAAGDLRAQQEPFNPYADQAARTLLAPQTYDPRVVSPELTVDPAKIRDDVSSATNVDSAIAAAETAAGTIGLNLPPVAPAPALDLTAPAGLTPAPDLTAPTLPGVSPAVEQQYGFDQLRLEPTGTTGSLTSLNAPRPQRIQGTPVEQLTNEQLEQIAGDETIPAITRRGASVELTARRSSATTETGRVEPTLDLQSLTVGPVAGTTISGQPRVEPTLDLPDVSTQPAAPSAAAAQPGYASTTYSFLSIPQQPGMRDLPAAPVGGEAAARSARETAQRSVDAWSASAGQPTPAVFNPASPELDSAVNQIAQAVNSQFAGRIYAYNDNRPEALNGIAIGKVAFVNTANVDVNAARTSLHEFKHTVEQIAAAEERAGQTGTAAQKFVAEIDSLYDDMTEAGKRAYLTNFLAKDELAGIADATAREARIQELMADPATRSEMTADFLGNRATDKQFWQDVAEADPEGFRGFVEKWLRIIDNLLAQLRGTKTQGRKESAKVDEYVRDLNRAKMVAREALIAYSKATRAQAPVQQTQQTQPADQLQASQREADFTDPERRLEVSTTRPVPAPKKGRTSNSYTEKWVIDGKDVRASAKHVAAVMRALRSYNTLSGKGNAEKLMQELHDVVVENLLWFHDLVPAAVRERAKLWYDGANRIATDWTGKFGISLQQASGVLAVLSPQMDWFKNVSLGERVIHIWRNRQNEAWSPAMTAWLESWVNASKDVDTKASRQAVLEEARPLQGVTLAEMNDRQAALFIRVFDETYHERQYRLVTPEGGFGDYVTNSDDGDASVTWGGFDTIEKAVSILNDGSFRNVEDRLGDEHKVRNFFNNIINPGSADGHVTIDTHAVAAALVKALSGSSREVADNFGSAGRNAETGASGTYGLFADAYRDAAARRGILPREMQSITWEAVRALFPASIKDQLAPQVDAVWDRFRKGELTRDQAREEVRKLAGGIRPMAWEGTDAGKFAADGGASFNAEIPEQVDQRQARTLPPEIAKDKIQINLSANTSTIPGVAALQAAAARGDMLAHRLLQDIALDNLRHLLAGTSARVKADGVTGLYGGYVESGLSMSVSFADYDRPAVLAALAKFADNFNQEQVHVRRGIKAKAGTTFDDGSYATPVYRWELKKGLSRKQIEKVIADSGLPGLTFGDDFVEAYYVGDPSDETARRDFDQAIDRAGRLLGRAAESVEQSVARLWAYGDGDRGLGFAGIRGDVPAGTGVSSETAKRVAGYLNQVKGKDGKPALGKVKTFDQPAEITPQQDALQTRIAQAYDGLPENDLKNPNVRKAYAELSKEVLRQFRAMPIKLEVYTGTGEPYANSAAMRRDVLDNNHLFIYGTRAETFGPEGQDFSAHPLLADSGERDVNGYKLLYNDLLRGVHDYYAHAMSPAQFGPKGEEAAWKNHMSMTSNMWARWALTMETRAQNSWVNFREGLDRNTPISQRSFAPQKAALLPVEFTLTGDRTVDKPMKEFIAKLGDKVRQGSKPVAKPAMSQRQVDTPEFKRFFRGSKVVDENGQPLVVYHGTSYAITGRDEAISEFAGGVVAGWFGPDPKIAEQYANKFPDDDEDGSIGQQIYPAYLSIQNPFKWKGVVTNQLTATKAAKDLAAALNVDVGVIKAMITSDDQLAWRLVESRRFVDLLKSKGYDGIQQNERGFETFAAFYPTQIKSAIGNSGEFSPANPDIRRSSRQRNALGLYSALAEGVEGIKTNTAPAAGWRDAIKGLVNKGQAKADEVEWSGINDWLALQQGKVTKDAVVEYLRGNGVQVEETVLGDRPYQRKFLEASDNLDRAADSFFNALRAAGRVQIQTGEFAGQSLYDDEVGNLVADKELLVQDLPAEFQGLAQAWLDSQEEYERVREQANDYGSRNETKYGKWTLPGGARYREVLLTLPSKAVMQQRWTAYGADGYSNGVYNSEAEAREAAGPDGDVERAHSVKVGGSSDFRSTHWDQPNVLAHIRVNDRTDADGNKVLFVEEIQSDWGQEGKKRGFDKKVFDVLSNGNVVAPRVEDRAEAEQIAAQYPNGEVRTSSEPAKVPSAPFVTKTEGWLNLALKRVLTMAVEGGYDKVAFTNGAQNAERYDLSKQISRVTFNDNTSGGVGNASLDGPTERGMLEAFDLDGRRVISEFINDPVKIQDYIGKEVAEKLLAAKPKNARSGGIGVRQREVAGLDLKIGGEGMKVFYDTIVPNAVRTLAKKLGGQVETVKVSGAAPDKATDTLGFDVSETQVKRDPSGNWYVERSARFARAGEARYWTGEGWSTNEGNTRLFRSEAAAKASLSGFVQPGLTITDAMREKVGEGLPMFSRRQRQAGGIVFGRDELGRVNFAPGAKAYDIVANVANNVLDKIAMKPVSDELGRAMRNMKVEVERVQNQIALTAKELAQIPQDEREMISDVIEGELRAGIHPPQHVLQVAASMQSIMSEQSRELVRLGMLSQEAANRWDQEYLPRFYESKLGDEVTAWAKAAKALFSRQPMMQGIRGSSLKARGMFETVAVADLPQWLAQGWEQRDANFDPAISTETVVWRDYSRQEREDMGEIRDAMFRFVMGYNRTQRDIALGRLYESLAQNYASAGPQDGYVLVPDTKVEGTMAARYGKLAGKYVPKEVMDHLSVNDETMMEGLFKIYKAGLSKWKEGKTVLNPVSHANNVISNLTMAHFAGVSYWDVQKYAGAVKDLVTRDPMVAEAKDIGLFGGTFSQSEIVASMPPQLRAMAGMSESKIAKLGEGLWDILAYTVSWNGKKYGARPVMQWAYENEDLFFRYLVYRDARGRGMAPEDAREYAQQFLFTYDDLPKGARTVRDVGLPFFSYTYKVVPVLARTALEYPWRYFAPAMAAYAANAMMYAMAASLGGDDDDWWGKVLYKWVTDKKFRERARALEDEERKNLPPWMKGDSAMLGTPKAVRLGMDSVTGLPMFLDISRIFPGGDLLDAQNNAGGVALLQPLTPSNPLLTATVAMLANKDMFFGKDVVKATDTDAEKAQKRAAWLWKQVSPAIAVGNYHFDRAMNVIASMTGKPITVDAGPLGVIDYTGTGRDGLPVQPGLAALQTMGIKVRPYDLDTAEAINKAAQDKLIRELTIEINRINRLESKGAISPEAADLMRDRQREKKDRLREGLTVEGEPR